MDETKLIRFLTKLPLFKHTPETVLARVASQVEMRSLDKGDILIRRNDPSDSLFIIRTGWVKIVAEGIQGEEVILNQAGPGQIIGEMSLIDQQPRSNTVITVSPTTVIEIKYDVVLAVLEEHPDLVISFLRDMSARLRFANAYIEETIEWCQHIAAGNYDFVQEQVEQTQSTIIDMGQSHQSRASAFLSIFFKMVRDIRQREENLKLQVQQLTIEIDEVKRQQAVKELTETEFFEELQEAAQKLREKRQAELKNQSEQ
jgi:CRP-like cAMP-binding protein